MGQDIGSGVFHDEDFAQFQKHLASEMELLRRWFAEDKFCDDGLQAGLELEAWLISRNAQPAPDNVLFLQTLDRKSVVPELSKFNFEINVLPQRLRGFGLRDMQSELSTTWARCRSVAERMNHRVLSIGILPTVTDDMLCVDNMSNNTRYAALNEQVLRLRDGRPVTLHIEGEDHLESQHYDLMLESAATSVQVHLKTQPQFSVRYYNASLLASAFTVALAANAPLMFGRQLWDDTRITVFEQAVDTGGQLPRVSFGSGYVSASLLELFEENYQKHRVLLPATIAQAPARMPYVRMHNGTIWNWNRPLIGFESDGRPHLRIEHRPMSASPSLVDLFADVTFYFGLVQKLAASEAVPEQDLPFESCRDNFYSAAKHSLNAPIRWLKGRTATASDLLRDELVELAMEGAAELGIDSQFVAAQHEVLKGRVATLQNGAAWQRRKFCEYDRDLLRLLSEYEANQSSGQPVHMWS